MSLLLLKWCQRWANNTQHKALVLLWLTNLSRNGEDFALNSYSAKLFIKKNNYMDVKCRIKSRNEEQKSGLDFFLSAFLSAYAVCLKYQELFSYLFERFQLEGNCLGRNLRWVLFSKVAIAPFYLASSKCFSLQYPVAFWFCFETSCIMQGEVHA